MADAARAHVVMLVRNAYTHDTRVEKEARALVGTGRRVTIVADAAPGLSERESRDGSNVIRVRRPALPVPGLRFLLHQWRLAGRLAALQPTILHGHDSNALVPVALAAARLGVPFVYDAHDLWLGRPRRERSRAYFALNQAWYALVERLTIPRAAAVITVSRPIADHLRRRYRLRRVHLVPNFPEAVGAGSRRELRDLPGGDAIDQERPIVLYLGGLMAGRGLEQLVDAVGRVPDAQLVLLGDGVLEQPLRDRAIRVGTPLVVLPPVSPTAVESYAESAAVGVSPIVPSCLNYRYSLPNKLFQYMAAGIPVVASDFPQVREVVEGAACGVVVDTLRPDAIAGAIETILRDPEAAAAMGARGRAAVRDRYNWATAAAVLRAVYEEL